MKSYYFLSLIFFMLTQILPVRAQDSVNIRLGVIADIQYCDCETRGQRFYAHSTAKLDSCVAHLNEAKVSFTANLGDLTDRDAVKNLDIVLACLKRLEAPVYNIPGNHDFGGITDNNWLYRLLGMPAPYYSITLRGWRFVFLNTNELASYANIAGTPLEKEYQTLLQEIKLRGGKNAAEYNGGISRRQLRWLQTELSEAQKSGEEVMVFSHHPLYAATGLTALNDTEIINVLTSFPCVKVVISGHHHAGAFGTFRGLPFITTEGMVETEHQNAYSIVDITGERIHFRGQGRSKSYVIELKVEN